MPLGTEQFTLKYLHEIYQTAFFDVATIDVANFRRKVEAARGFVRPVEGPEGPKARGRPPRWYEQGWAGKLDPPIHFRAPRRRPKKTQDA